MDNFDTNRVALNDSLSELTSINRLLGNTKITLNVVIEIVQAHPEKLFHIVDLGCGAGDNLRAIGDWCFKNDREIVLTGIDGNVHILDYAKSQKSMTKINFKQADILDAQFELEACDILISSHFIYRFTDDQLVNFINKSIKKVSKAIIFSELQRHVFSYYAFTFLGKLWSFSPMIIQDGLKAIKNSFQERELRNILERLDASSYTLQWKWAFRYLIRINC